MVSVKQTTELIIVGFYLDLIWYSHATFRSLDLERIEFFLSLVFLLLTLTYHNMEC